MIVTVEGQDQLRRRPKTRRPPADGGANDDLGPDCPAVNGSTHPPTPRWSAHPRESRRRRSRICWIGGRFRRGRGRDRLFGSGPRLAACEAPILTSTSRLVSYWEAALAGRPGRPQPDQSRRRNVILPLLPHGKARISRVAEGCGSVPHIVTPAGGGGSCLRAGARWDEDRPRPRLSQRPQPFDQSHCLAAGFSGSERLHERVQEVDGANRRRNAAAWVCITDRLHPLPDERAGPQRRFPCSMQLHARVRPAGERASDGIQGDLRRPVQGLLMHLVERLVHQPREGALD